MIEMKRKQRGLFYWERIGHSYILIPPISFVESFFLQRKV